MEKFRDARRQDKREGAPGRKRTNWREQTELRKRQRRRNTE